MFCAWALRVLSLQRGVAKPRTRIWDVDVHFRLSQAQLKLIFPTSHPQITRHLHSTSFDSISTSFSNPSSVVYLHSCTHSWSIFSFRSVYWPLPPYSKDIVIGYTSLRGSCPRVWLCETFILVSYLIQISCWGGSGIWIISITTFCSSSPTHKSLSHLRSPSHSLISQNPTKSRGSHVSH